jgi:glycogen debranching enzyme
MSEAMKNRFDKPPELGDDAIQILEGSTFAVSDPVGDFPSGVVAGLFHRDTRHLSKLELTIGGERPKVLTSGPVDYFSASFALANPDLPDVREHSISIDRYRLLAEAMRDSIHIESHLSEPVRVELRLSCGADFADLFEVKDGVGEKAGALEVGPHAGADLAFRYTNGPFSAGTWIRCTTTPDRVEGTDLVWDLDLEPRGTWVTGVRVAFDEADAHAEPTHSEFVTSSRQAERVFEKWKHQTPTLESDNDLIGHVFRKSLVDLAALRLEADFDGLTESLPAAGLPWFMAIFGRDTLITSYQSIWVGPDLARGALYALAKLQGTKVGDFRDEEPGKILHEIRYGEQTVLGLKPHSPYYGSCDATPLWLILLSEYWRWTGDGAACSELKSAALSALGWIDGYGDRDDDGYVEYDTRSSQGLENQGWKDSWDGVLFADGSLPKRPIALAEIQGYVYDAKVRLAEIADVVWEDAGLASRLRDEAASLRARFDRDFWIEERGGFYAIGLDGEKRRIDSKTSNMGHLLWCGIVPEERAENVRDQLMGEGLFSGWGVRTLSNENGFYNPIGYHRGTVWPHDNSIVSAGLARYGFREDANRIAMAMFDAAAFSGHRLPEAFAGYRREPGRFPVSYPTACSPQAWATAATFLWLRVMLGMEPKDGAITTDPKLPDGVGDLTIRGVHAFGERVDTGTPT